MINTFSSYNYLSVEKVFLFVSGNGSNLRKRFTILQRRSQKFITEKGLERKSPRGVQGQIPGRSLGVKHQIQQPETNVHVHSTGIQEKIQNMQISVYH